MSSSERLQSRLAHCRRMFLRDYEAQIHIGVHDFEKKAQQRVLFNIELFVPLIYCTPVDDKLSEVVDYHIMHKAIEDQISQGHIHLQETLCDGIARALLAFPQVYAVGVSTQKRDVYANCYSVGVEVFHIKEES